VSTPWRHIRGVEIQLHSFLLSALHDQSFSCPDPLFLGNKTCSHNAKPGGSRAGLGVLENRKVYCCCLFRTPDHAVRSPATTSNAPFRVHVAHKPPTAYVAHLVCGTLTDLRNLRGQISYLQYCHATHYVDSCHLLRKSGMNSCIQNDSSVLRYSTRVCTTLILYFLLSRMYIANRN
jgi:hypothetical protein